MTDQRGLWVETLHPHPPASNFTPRRSAIYIVCNKSPNDITYASVDSVAVSMHASQACDPGSSPGPRTLFYFCLFVVCLFVEDVINR